MNIEHQTNIGGDQTNIQQGEGSTAQVAHGNPITQMTASPEQRRLCWWAKVLMTLCILGALVSLALGILGRLDWVTAAVLIVALLGALPLIERMGR